MHELAFRQIHADFHSSPQLEIIGSQFDKKEWQETLKKAEVESITLFATCHHGWCYYDTKVGERSPSLKFDLLRAEMEACHEIGIRTPVYFTGGLNCYAAEKHADWCFMERSGKIYDPVYPHFKGVCFNTPYLDFLCAEIKEVIENYPLCDGIFIDIISAHPLPKTAITPLLTIRGDFRNCRIESDARYTIATQNKEKTLIRLHLDPDEARYFRFRKI